MERAPYQIRTGQVCLEGRNVTATSMVHTCSLLFSLFLVTPEQHILLSDLTYPHVASLLTRIRRACLNKASRLIPIPCLLLACFATKKRKLHTELFTATPFTSRIRLNFNVPAVGLTPDYLSQIKLSGFYSSMLSLLH